MKIKRFQAEDVRTTIRKVRETLGPDAVILSNKRVNGGIEIIAAIDYDESLMGGVVAETHVEVRTQKSGSVTQQASANHSPAAKTTERSAYQKHVSTQQATSRQRAADDIRYSRNIPPSAEKTKIPAKATAAVTENASITDYSSYESKPASVTREANNLGQELADVQNEIKSLRGLLLNQMSGMAWDAEAKQHPTRTRLLQRLIALGLSPVFAKQLCNEVDETKEFDAMWRHALGVLSHQVPVIDNGILKTGGVMALVGPTGVGKTTTIAKLAARYVLEHGKDSVGLITTDNFRVAAHEQLRSYARILGVPLRVATDKDELNDALYDLRHKKLVLIDTAGVSLHDSQLREQLDLLNSGSKSIHMFLALAANTQRSVLNDVVTTFKQSKIDGCILTKIDETTSLGGAISIAAEHNLPIAYYCDGQKVPDDLHIARAHNLVSKSVSIMQKITLSAQKNISDGMSAEHSMALKINGMVAHAHG